MTDVKGYLILSFPSFISISGWDRINMRGLDENTEVDIDVDALIRTGQHAQARVRHAWDGFINFAARDNVLEVALGLMQVLWLYLLVTILTSSRIANAFTKVVTSFVSDLVLPIVSLLPFLNRNMDQKFAVLSKGPNYTSEGYNTLHQAREDGALVLAYGYVCQTIK